MNGSVASGEQGVQLTFMRYLGDNLPGYLENESHHIMPFASCENESQHRWIGNDP